MNWNYKKLTELFSKKENYKLFSNSLHGLERECLRIDKDGDLAQSPHPQKLGSALTHPYITTDFSESQLELITPTFQREEGASTFLKALHCFINQNVKDELIWPFSMPCRLPKEDKIPLGEYGPSTTGQNKTLYREGLAHRYGRKMQTVSGTHYNFSFSEELWQFLYKKFARKEQDLQNFITESYFHIMRNFLRNSWINTLLFGAAPAVDKTYLKKKPKSLKRMGWNTYYGPYATSIRMSDLGYYSKVQSQLTISYDSLEKYLTDMQYALTTKSASYKGKPGLNENILQIENEHYSRIRPKQVLKAKEKAVDALKKRGVRYLEVRALDINPFQPIGIARHQLRFIHILLIHSLFQRSPKISKKEAKLIRDNQNKVAIYGRKPGLKLQTLKGEKTMLELAQKLLKELDPIAKMLDGNFHGNRYNKSLEMQLAKLEDFELLSSARMLREMKEQKLSFAKYGISLAEKNKQRLNFCEKTSSREKMLEEAVAQSYKDQADLELIESSYLAGYEDLEVSTQMVMKEAIKRGLKVEIISRKQNLIRISKKKKSEIIKQATFTSKDSVVSYFLMEDKSASKKILAERGLKVPSGLSFQSVEAALENYGQFKDKQLVVKPNHTNFGVAVHFVKKNNKKAYEKAVIDALDHSDSVIVEEFIEGKEYRILVIDGKAVAVVHRVPAHVIGDGETSIGKLVEMKNADPKNYKFFPKYEIKLGETEKSVLRSQNLNSQSVPAKGRTVYLRHNSNVSTGGDSIDMTAKLHDSYKEIAVQAAQAADATFCGVDMIINDIRKSASEENYSIIEINFNPNLQIHGFVVKGEKIDVASHVLDALGF